MTTNIARFADEGIAEFVATASLPPLRDHADIEALRRATDERAAGRPPGPDLADVRDMQAPDRPARLYRPNLDASGPVVLWLHGGGWTFGGPDSHDRMARRLAATSGVAVLSLDYRLAPEHVWPAAVDDTVAALRWLASAPPELGFVADRVVVGGDSSGGTLAALACLRLRDDPAAPVAQVLAYADTDLTCDQPSASEKAVGWGLDLETVFFFNRTWVPDRERWTDGDVSPLFAPDLSGVAPAIVVTAEHDVLRDQGARYADRLRDAGVPVRYRCEELMIHNFLLMDLRSPACAAAADRLATDVRTLLGNSHPNCTV